jgi:hypothetical protein
MYIFIVYLLYILNLDLIQFLCSVKSLNSDTCFSSLSIPLLTFRQSLFNYCLIVVQHRWALLTCNLTSELSKVNLNFKELSLNSINDPKF